MHHGAEQLEPVDAAQLLLAAALGVGHHPQHVAAPVRDAGDRVHGAVRVGRRHYHPPLVAVAEDDLAVLLDPAQRRRVREVGALAVRDRDPQHLVAFQDVREGQVVALGDQVRPLAAELGRVVADQRPRQQAGLAEDLKAVADAPDQAAPLGKIDDARHDRREARDGARAQMVAVAEATGQDDAVTALQVRVLVPEVAEVLAEHLVDHPTAVPVRPGPGEHHDSEPQPEPSSSTSNLKSSITWLASSFTHISLTRRRAASGVSAESRTSMYLPTRTSATSSKPSWRRPCLTVSPWGSFTTGFGVTITFARRVTRAPW